MRRSPTRHHANIDPTLTDPRTGTEYCSDAPKGCGLPASHPVHVVPERSEDERATTARIVGERA